LDEFSRPDAKRAMPKHLAKELDRSHMGIAEHAARLDALERKFLLRLAMEVQHWRVVVPPQWFGWLRLRL
jgi:hypothetical protein